MIQNILKFATPTLLALFASFYFYRDGKQSAEFKQKMEQIETVRKALQDSVIHLQKRTADREEKLRTILTQNMSILDTLNSSLARVNKSTKAIDGRIAENQKNIEDLWKNN